MAEAVFRNFIKNQVPKLKTPSHVTFGEIDSAGTGAYHVHSPPDPRTMSTLKQKGVTDYEHSARKVQKADFTTFDYVLAMDEDNLDDLLRLRSRVVEEKKNKATQGGATDYKVADVRLFGDFQGGNLTKKVGGGEEVPDPYYGGKNGFDLVYGQVLDFSEGFYTYLNSQRAG